MISWTWFGKPGHSIDASPRFHLHTHVGDKCVSTVGDFPGATPTAYETRVYQIDPTADPSKWKELDVRRYSAHDDAAENGHLSLCVKHSDISFTDEVTQS